MYARCEFSAHDKNGTYRHYAADEVVDPEMFTPEQIEEWIGVLLAPPMPPIPEAQPADSTCRHFTTDDGDGEVVET